jgi:gliding motility-associated-like protein
MPLSFLPFGRYLCLLVCGCLFGSVGVWAQVQLTVPWGPVVNVGFGVEPGPGIPLPAGATDFTYTTDACPGPGQYSIVTSENCAAMDIRKTDAGHFYLGPAPSQDQPAGYMLLASYHPSATPITLFRQTVHNLCSTHPYLFWASILRASGSTCFYPNLTMSVETLSGVVVQAFPTGDIMYVSGAYPGTIGTLPKPPPFGFYGGEFVLPAGVTDCVVKITVSPSTAYADCTASLLLDNIEVVPVGPDVTISSPGGGFITGACFEGGKPLVLNGQIGTSHLLFNTSTYIPGSYAVPAVQWQQSLDDGYTWVDIPGETGLNLSRAFTIPDSFYIRLRSSEGAEIGDINCSVVSNIVEVQVDGLPAAFGVGSNSPVCTDSDVVFTLSGGASYQVTGPNGFDDNSEKPHIYNPKLSDSGWYYAQITTFGGCTVEDSTHVAVIGPDLRVSADADICYGKTVQLQASGGSSYNWTPAAGLSDAGIANPLASPRVTTTYMVRVKDGSGCSAIGTVKIQLLDGLLKAAFLGPDVACPRDLIQFSDTSQGGIVGWDWDFGNGQRGVGREPVVQVYPFGDHSVDYAVRLIVTDTAGCKDTAVRSVRSVPNCFIAVPSAFSPNGDGNNDYLYPLDAYKARGLVFRVYNRAGVLVFETRDWTKKWDGRLNGHGQPEGVYVWTLAYTDAEGKRQALKGTTVLVR